MLETVSNISPYLEVLSYLAGIIIAVVGIIGLRQLFLLKYDIKARYQREANHEAMELIKRYADKTIPLCNKLDEQRRNENIPEYKEEEKGVSYISKEYVERALARIPKNVKYLVAMLNELEFIAAGVNSRLVNEEIVFDSFGKSFCNTVRQNYDVISILEARSIVKSFNNIVILYDRWQKRIQRIELESKKTDIDEALKRIIDQRISSIGTDLR